MLLSALIGTSSRFTTAKYFPLVSNILKSEKHAPEGMTTVLSVKVSCERKKTHYKYNVVDLFRPLIKFSKLNIGYINNIQDC